MAVGVLIHASEADETLYENVREELGWHDEPFPEGFISHYAGPDPDGGWFIFDLWDSREHYEQFARKRLEPVFARLGGTAPQPKFIEILSEDQVPTRR